MRQLAIDRRLSILNDHLLRDIGVDPLMLRERARAAELGSPSRSSTAAEIMPGVPAQHASRSRPWPGKPPMEGEGAPSPIRLVPDRPFRA